MPVTEFSIRTPRHDCMIDITAQVAQTIADSGITDGIVTVYTPHTTSGITINENADPDVMHDLEAKLGKLMPWREEKFARRRQRNRPPRQRQDAAGNLARPLFLGIRWPPPTTSPRLHHQRLIRPIRKISPNVYMSASVM